MTIKDVTNTAQSNLVGLVLGGVAGYYIAKKAAKVENKWAIAGIAVVGAIAGAMMQSKMAAKKASAAVAVEAKK